MKAKAYQISALKNEIQGSFLGALVYGPDFGVVDDTASTIAHLITPNLKDDFAVVRITPARIKENKAVILDEANTPSLMGGRRLIWIKDADNNSADIIDRAATELKTNAFLLFTADSLPKNSALRIAAENHPKFLTIACYADDEREIQNTILAQLHENGYSVSNNALILLKEQLIDNRVATRYELEKLMTYMGDQKNIEEIDVQAILTPSSTASFDELCLAVASGKQKEVDQAYHLLLAAGENPVGIVRVLITYFNKLLLGVCSVSKGDSYDIAVKKILRPAQFKMEPEVKKQLSIWKKEWLIRTLALLSETEKQTKTTALPAELMLARTLILITSVPAKGRR